MSDTLRERCEKLIESWQKWADRLDVQASEIIGSRTGDFIRRRANELRAALATPEPAASHSAETEARLLIQDLAMLVRRLIRRVHKFDVSDGVAEQARQFVERKGLHGSVTRSCQDNFGTKAEMPEPAASETDLERAKRWLGHDDVACERDTSIECLAAEFAQLRAERDREIDTLRERCESLIRQWRVEPIMHRNCNTDCRERAAVFGRLADALEAALAMTSILEQGSEVYNPPTE